MTDEVHAAVERADVTNGMALVYSPHTTCAVVINEHESGFIEDFSEALAELALRHLLPGPFLPHTLLRGETVLEVVARPGVRILLRQALFDGYGSLREDVLRLISKTAEVDLHGRWWREEA